MQFFDSFSLITHYSDEREEKIVIPETGAEQICV